jgi:hypothetical protein
LFRLIDWLLQLPEPMEREFRADILRNEEKLMPYVTSFERFAKEEGHQEGRQEGARTSQEMIKDALLVRFGELPKELVMRIEAEKDLKKLKSLHHLALTARDLAHFLREG